MDTPLEYLQLCLLVVHCAIGAKITDIDVAKEFLADYNERAMEVYYRKFEAKWMFSTNITDENQRKQVSQHGRSGGSRISQGEPSPKVPVEKL